MGKCLNERLRRWVYIRRPAALPYMLCLRGTRSHTNAVPTYVHMSTQSPIPHILFTPNPACDQFEQRNYIKPIARSSWRHSICIASSVKLHNIAHHGQLGRSWRSLFRSLGTTRNLGTIAWPISVKFSGNMSDIKTTLHLSPLLWSYADLS